MDEIVKSFKFSLTGKQISKKNMKQFKDIVALMKEYINDRFKDDNAMSTQVNSVIRKLDKLLIELKIPIDELYKNEYSSGRAYDLLTKLNNGTNFNPLLWSKETGISNKSPSVDVYSKQKYTNTLILEMTVRKISYSKPAWRQIFIQLIL